jgi:flagellin-specific chaperone FliS
MLKALAITAFALASLLPAAAEDRVAELKQKAKTEQGPELAEALAKLAYEHVLIADHHFTEGHPAEGHKTVAEVVRYAEQARDVAIHHGRKVKKAEITLRKAMRKLEDVRRSLAFEDQGEVAKAVERLQQIQDEILEAMFAPKPKREGKS